MFRPGGVHFLVDSDPHYHAVRAATTLARLPAVPWRDPFLNYPTGAPILWPPGFDLVVAVGARLLGGTEAVERVAAALPALFGVAAVLVVGVLGSQVLGRPHGLTVALVFALLPEGLQYTLLGRGDHHAAELLLGGLAHLAFLRLWTSARAGLAWREALLLAVILTAAAWTWHGSSLYLAEFVGFAAVHHVAGSRLGDPQRAARNLALAFLGAALLLGLSLGLAAPGQLRETAMAGVSSFHLSLSLVVAAFAALLAGARFRWPDSRLPRRAGEVLVAVAVPLVAAFALVPGFLAVTERGLAPVVAGSAWYTTIDEYAPLLFGGWYSLREEGAAVLKMFGLSLAAMPLCLPAIVRAWRRRPEERVPIAFVWFWGSLFFVLTLFRARFGLYLTVPVALWIALAGRELSQWAGGRWPRGRRAATIAIPLLTSAVVLAPTLPALRPGTFREAPLAAAAAPLLRWLAAEAAPPGREAVFSSWSLGYLIRYYAGRPVVASPFGTDGGAGAMEDTAAFFLAASEEAAEGILASRWAGLVLLPNPVPDVQLAQRLLPGSTRRPLRERFDWREGGSFELTADFASLPAAQLYFRDGTGQPPAGVPGLGGFRLMYETPATQPSASIMESRLKLFAVVAGARVVVEGARPRSLVVGTVPVVTNQGRRFLWSTVATADEAGRAVLRVPYASGRNGRVEAGPCMLADGASVGAVEIGEDDVTTGRAIDAPLAPRPRS